LHLFSRPKIKLKSGDKMKVVKSLVVLLLICTVAFAQANKGNKDKKSESAALKTQNDSVSYCIGQNIYQNLKDPALGVNVDILTQSLKDAAAGKSTLTQEEIMKVLTALQGRMQKKQMETMKEQEEKKKVVLDKNKKEGDAFLAENKTKEGVKITASGLQYKILTCTGTGDLPKDTSKVKVHYKGTLLDGTEFDSSYKRGEPIEFPLNGVIKGWTEGVQLMHVGDKFQFFIPSELAYGENGAGELIGPGAVLIFEVELLGITK
jgi:FKBP-type peptidyl-prolyl cis-trans isomerase FklB